MIISWRCWVVLTDIHALTNIDTYVDESFVLGSVHMLRGPQESGKLGLLKEFRSGRIRIMMNHSLFCVWPHPHSIWERPVYHPLQNKVAQLTFLFNLKWKSGGIEFHELFLSNSWTVLESQIATWVVSDDIQVLIFKFVFVAYFSAVCCLNFSSVLYNIINWPDLLALKCSY